MVVQTPRQEVLQHRVGVLRIRPDIYACADGQTALGWTDPWVAHV